MILATHELETQICSLNTCLFCITRPSPAKTLEAIERNGGSFMFRHQQTVDDFEVSRL
jgi:hypothetical protein